MTDFYPDWAEWDKDLETLKSMMKRDFHNTKGK